MHYALAHDELNLTKVYYNVINTATMSVKALQKQHPANFKEALQRADSEGATPFIYALRSSKAACIEFLITCGASTDLSNVDIEKQKVKPGYVFLLTMFGLHLNLKSAGCSAMSQ